jgi:hypothetical protein
MAECLLESIFLAEVAPAHISKSGLAYISLLQTLGRYTRQSNVCLFFALLSLDSFV